MRHENRSIDEWLEVFRSGEKGRNEAGAALVAIGRPAAIPLMSLLKETEAPITRAVAASTLCLMRENATEAVSALERSLSRDRDPVVRLRAAQALVGIAGATHAESVKYLRETARSADPALAQWIKADAKIILRDAGISE